MSLMAGQLEIKSNNVLKKYPDLRAHDLTGTRINVNKTLSGPFPAPSGDVIDIDRLVAGFVSDDPKADRGDSAVR